MSFRSPDTKPLAYLVHDSGAPLECRLMGFEKGGLIVSAPDLRTRIQGPLPQDIQLALDVSPLSTQPTVAAILHSGGPGKDEYPVKLDQPRVFWQAAMASQDFNRRQAFRVRNLDYGADRPGPDMELSSRIELGSTQIEGEIINLSLGGCTLRVSRSSGPELPKVGSRILCVLEGPALEESLRLPSIVKRKFHRTKKPRMGLKFQARENPAWLRAEYQLQDYLMERQRQHLSFRRAA